MKTAIFEKELKWRLDAFHDGILSKTAIIEDMEKIVADLATEHDTKIKQLIDKMIEKENNAEFISLNAIQAFEELKSRI